MLHGALPHSFIRACDLRLNDKKRFLCLTQNVRCAAPRLRIFTNPRYAFNSSSEPSASVQTIWIFVVDYSRTLSLSRHLSLAGVEHIHPIYTRFQMLLTFLYKYAILAPGI